MLPLQIEGQADAGQLRKTAGLGEDQVKALFENDDVAMHSGRGGGVNGRALLLLLLLLLFLLRLLVLLQKAELCRHGKLPASASEQSDHSPGSCLGQRNQAAWRKSFVLPNDLLFP